MNSTRINLHLGDEDAPTPVATTSGEAAWLTIGDLRLFMPRNRVAATEWLRTLSSISVDLANQIERGYDNHGRSL